MWNLLCQYNNIYTSLHKYLKGKKKKKKTLGTIAIVPVNETKSTVATVHTHIHDKAKTLHDKCCNIFSKHLFLVVIGYSLIFYYFISTCKKLTRQ